MSLSDDQMQTIIERAQRSMRAEPGVLASTPGEEWDALVLVPGFVPAPEKALSAVFAQFGKQTQIVFLSEAVFSAEGIPACRLDWATQKNELVELMVRAQRVVLLAPSTGLLTRMGSGAASEDVSEALIRRILWGKSVDVLLDFEPPKFQRGTYFAQLAEAIDALCGMGFVFSTYQPVVSCSEGVHALVTERDIVEAKQSGRKQILCAAGAIVTPLAVDTAKELQIHIQRAQE